MSNALGMIETKGFVAALGQHAGGAELGDLAQHVASERRRVCAGQRRRHCTHDNRRG